MPQTQDDKEADKLTERINSEEGAKAFAGLMSDMALLNTEIETFLKRAEKLYEKAIRCKNCKSLGDLCPKHKKELDEIAPKEKRTIKLDKNEYKKE
jgi:hypothetical protein